MEIKDIIKSKRLELGLTLDEVAKIVGVSGATISRWETGDIKNMRRDKIGDLAKALQTTPSVIMGWEKPEKNKGLLVCEEIQQYEKDSTQAEINKAIGELNQEGKEKVLEYAKDLQGTGRYKKFDKSGVG